MAKKPSAIYEPGELEKVRGRLGHVDENEAKRIAQKLGGEVGTERSVVTPPVKKTSYVKRDKSELAVPGRKNRKSIRPVATLDDEDDDYGRKEAIAKHGSNPADDPSVRLKTSYFERVKMDRYAAQPEFEIKSSFQALISIFSLFSDPVDSVNPRFINNRIDSYIKKVDMLVNATRALLPRNNARRSERLKKASPYYFSILDTIRFWDIERIDEELTKIKSHPRTATIFDFVEIIRNIYKPLFILEKLTMDLHIKGAFKVLYKVIYIEDPTESKDKSQEYIRVALSSFSDVRNEVHFGLYPILMKYISDRWFPYEQLFIERRRRLMNFLSLSEHDQIQPLDALASQAEDVNMEKIKEDADKGNGEEEGKDGGAEPESAEDAEKKAREDAALVEKKAVEHSLKALESLFPKAGWDKLEEYPDLYPYFVNVYQMRRGYELIGPSDPLQQIAVLMHIMDDLCTGLQSVTFGTAAGADGSPARIGELIGSTITNWRRLLDDSFSKAYLPRLTDYCRMLEHSAESRTSTYAKRTLNEIRWTKRLYFLPYFKFDSMGPPPFQKQDVTAIYGEVRTLRKYITMVAAGIEQGNKIGGAEAKAHCDGIDNPWEKYHFEIANPVSKRLDALLPPNKRNNTVLVFFALAVVTILDDLLNNENSWAYGEKVGPVFRSVNNLGVTPVFGVDNKLDADKIFKETMMSKGK